MAFLDPLIQVCELEFGQVPSWPTNPPPPDLTVFPPLTDDFRSHLDIMSGLPDLTDLGVVVLQFADRTHPRVYTWNPDKLVTIGSLAKVAILYAAFQLRADVRSVVGVSPTTVDQLQDRLTALWATSPYAAFATGLVPPALDKIFDLSALAGPTPSKIDFLGTTGTGFDVDEKPKIAPLFETVGHTTRKIKSDADCLRELAHRNVHAADATATDKTVAVPGLELLERTADGSTTKWDALATLPFMRRLWMTTVWSDNSAATSCQCDLGLPYIQALLRASGLDDPDRPGLSLSRHYQLPAGRLATARFKPYVPKASDKVGGKQLFRLKSQSPQQAGTAASLARLMIALEGRTLISSSVSNDMLRLLRPIPISFYGFGSWTGGKLRDHLHGKPLGDHWSKIGISSDDGGTMDADWVCLEIESRNLGVAAVGARHAKQLEGLGDDVAIGAGL